ncbi:CRISPR-associated helicase Cas3' [Nocardiopsis sediminis]|uniref:CRISPR-associated helicase Cas3 n=1 Tax=Nocardiopsis sediminis TaxID=1778267 RepID=A0ABV8FPU8_9ACTN
MVRPWAKHDKGRKAGKKKAARKPGTHALVCHLIDTMEVAYLLYPIFLGPKVRGELEETFSPLSGEPRAWVALLCGLHDLGKYTPAFQSLVLEVAEARFPAEHHAILRKCEPARKRGGLDTKHGLSTGLHIEAMLEEAEAKWDMVRLISSVLAAHHGWFPEPGMLDDVRGKRDLGDRTWWEARSEMVRCIARLAGLEFQDGRWRDVNVSALGMIGLAGLTTISDWVASDSSFFPYESHPHDLVAYRDRARANAENALAKTNWSAWRPGERTRFTDLFKDESFKGGPRPVQTAVEECLEHCAEPGVLVIEAPTGEGKTMAGLQAAARLANRLGLGGLYLSTPTKSLSVQARDEVQKFLEATGSTLEANLVYSGAAKEQKAERDQRRKEKEKNEKASGNRTITPERIGHEGRDEEAQRNGAQEPWEWFYRKKGLAFPIGVGTVDQAVKSVIRSGHNFLGMTALSNKVVLIDEVHSYDAYTFLLVQQLMWFCGRMGVPVVLMSATLTGSRRVELIEYWHAGKEDRNADTERIQKEADAGSWQVTWSGSKGKPQPVELSEEILKRGTVRVDRGDDSPEAIAKRAVDAVVHGGTALVILNTKTRAHKVERQVRTLLDGERDGPELIFFTGDHQGEERAAIRDRLKARLGRTSSLSDRHAIVVGTQVLEHGLDLDADFLITDLCPIDLLFQRAGRLHRHKREHRPEGLCDPVLVVADRGQETGPRKRRHENLGFTSGISNVYSPWILGRSRAVLRETLDQGEWDPLEEIGRQIHRVYVNTDSLAEPGWNSAWRQAEKSHRQAVEKRRFNARSVMVPLGRSPLSVLRMTQRSVPGGLTRFSDQESDHAGGDRRGE